MHQRGKYDNWRDLSSGGVASRKRFVSRLGLPLNSWEIHTTRGKAESRRRQNCIDKRGFGILD